MEIAHNVSRFLRDEAYIRRKQIGGVIDDQQGLEQIIEKE